MCHRHVRHSLTWGINPFQSAFIIICIFHFGHSGNLNDTHLACPGPQIWLVNRSETFTFHHNPGDYTSNSCTWRLLHDRGLVPKNIYISVNISNWNLPCYETTRLYVKGFGDDIDKNPVCDSKYHQIFPGDVEIMMTGLTKNYIGDVTFEIKLKELSFYDNCNKSMSINKSAMELRGNLHPGNYIVPFRCWWKFTSNVAHSRIKIQILYIKIAGHLENQCQDNSLTIYDGGKFTDVKLIKTCFENIQMVVSTGKEIIVDVNLMARFETSTVFRLNVQAVDAAPSHCPSNAVRLFANSTDQYLASPGYPYRYANGLDCQWLLYSSGFGIEIEFLSIDLEDHDHCRFDYLEIYDGNTTSAKRLARICGNVNLQNSALKTFRSSGSELLIVFQSDVSNSEQGFKLKYHHHLLQPGDSDNDDLDDDDDDDDDGKSDSDDGHNTGVILGACLASIVGVFGLIFIFVWLVHKKRVREQRRRRARRSQVPSVQLNGSNPDVLMINPVIINNGASPPPYPGIVNEGFTEELPPNYYDVAHLPSVWPTNPPATTSSRPPPPPYSAVESPEDESNADEQPSSDHAPDGLQSNEALYNTIEEEGYSNHNLSQPDRAAEMPSTSVSSDRDRNSVLDPDSHYSNYSRIGYGASPPSEPEYSNIRCRYHTNSSIPLQDINTGSSHPEYSNSNQIRELTRQTEDLDQEAETILDQCKS